MCRAGLFKSAYLLPQAANSLAVFAEKAGVYPRFFSKHS
jgi:hypothetical protein